MLFLTNRLVKLKYNLYKWLLNNKVSFQACKNKQAWEEINLLTSYKVRIWGIKTIK